MTDVEGTEPSRELSQFRQALSEAAEASTVGVSTLSGVSPKNAALERLARIVGGMTSATEQVNAIEAILREAETLWPDQNAHVVSTIIQDLLIHGRIVLLPEAMPAVGHALVQSALRVEPELASNGVVNDSISHDVLISYTSFLLQRPEFGFSQEIRSRLDRAGFHEQAADLRYRDNSEQSPERQANRLRHQIALKSAYQMEPADLEPLVDSTANLPDDLRGRLLAMLINVSWNILRDPANISLVDRIASLVDGLPPRFRITPLEAFHNQIDILPHDLAKRCWPIVQNAIQNLPGTDDERFNRSRRDLAASLEQQGRLLHSLPFEDGESLVRYKKRTEAA